MKPREYESVFAYFDFEMNKSEDKYQNLKFNNQIETDFGFNSNTSLSFSQNT